MCGGCFLWCGMQEQQTALHISSRLGAVDCALLLLDNGATPDAATVELYTPLHIAAKEGHEDVVQLLLDRGANSGLATSVSVAVLTLPYLTFGVGRLLHLPSAEAVSVRPNA